MSVSKNLFEELLREKKGLRYIISVKITLKKGINDNDPKTRLNDSFEEILNLLDIWINEGSGWVIDEIKGLCINISNYEPLLGGSYITKSITKSTK